MNRMLLCVSFFLVSAAASGAEPAKEGQTVATVVEGRVVDPSTTITRRIDAEGAVTDTASTTEPVIQSQPPLQTPDDTAPPAPAALEAKQETGFLKAGFFKRFSRNNDTAEPTKPVSQPVSSGNSTEKSQPAALKENSASRNSRRQKPAQAASAPAITITPALPSRPLSNSADSRIVSNAANYTEFRDDVRTIDSRPISSMADVDAALEATTAFTPEDLTRGWISYAALVAMQNPTFIDNVRETADRFGRQEVIRGLGYNLAYAGMISGSELAIDEVLQQAAADAQEFERIGGNLKQQSYSIQSSNWAKGKLSDKQSRLNAIKRSGPVAAPSNVLQTLGAPGAVGQAELAARPDAVERFRTVFTRSSLVQSASYRSSYRLRPNVNQQTALDRAMTIAAFEALGASQEADRIRNGEIFLDGETRKCLADSRLQLEGCVSAVYNNFDLPFCVAKHSISDIAGCIAGN
jgi:hypothetical protein